MGLPTLPRCAGLTREPGNYSGPEVRFGTQNEKFEEDEFTCTRDDRCHSGCSTCVTFAQTDEIQVYDGAIAEPVCSISWCTTTLPPTA